MAITSARSIVNLKEGHFETENARIEKYTLGDELPAQLSQLALRTRPMAQPAYKVRRLGGHDKGLVLKFLRRFFFRDEPMNQAVNLLETPDSRCLELEEYAASTLDEGVSLAAVDDQGDLVGVIINGLARREEADCTEDKSESCPNAKFRQILKVLGHLEREAKIWDHIPNTCNTCIEVRIASTHTEWRGRGLMRVLCEETERIARDIGARAARMDTTSAFSAAAAERLHYRKIYSVMYKELPFAPQPKAPHLEASVYIKEL